MKISKSKTEKLNALGMQDCEIIECQDHYFRIYSNTLDAYLISQEFKTEAEALAYTFTTGDDWSKADINW